MSPSSGGSAYLGWPAVDLPERREGDTFVPLVAVVRCALPRRDRLLVSSTCEAARACVVLICRPLGCCPRELRVVLPLLRELKGSSGAAGTADVSSWDAFALVRLPWGSTLATEGASKIDTLPALPLRLRRPVEDVLLREWTTTLLFPLLLDGGGGSASNDVVVCRRDRRITPPVSVSIAIVSVPAPS